MSTFKQRLVTDWHPMRMIKLVFGVWAMVQAVQMHEYAIGIFGMFFLYQAVTNTGCCGAQGCDTPAPKKQEKDTGYIEFEEVK